MENTFFREINKSAIWTVSTVKTGYSISFMFNGKTDKFWQSDSTPPHWICAQFSKQTYISKLSMYLSIQEDGTYTPTEIVIHIGDDPSNLTEFKTFEPTHFQGWVDVEIGVSTIFFRITITKNHQGGRDSRIRLIKLYGAPYSPSLDSSICFNNPEISKYLSIR